MYQQKLNNTAPDTCDPVAVVLDLQQQLEQANQTAAQYYQQNIALTIVFNKLHELDVRLSGCCGSGLGPEAKQIINEAFDILRT